MSDELQSDDLTQDDLVVDVEDAQTENGSELATDSEPQHDKDGEESQEAINKRIGEYAFKARQAEREKAELEAKLRQYEQKQTAIPEVPPLPDVFDDDYEQKLVERDQIIAQRAKQLAIQEAMQYQQAQQQQQAVQQKIKQYNDNAVKNGVTQEDMMYSAQVIDAYLDPNRVDIVQGLLSDPDGALVSKALAANPDEILKLNQMDAWSAANYVATVIKPKAMALKPKQSKAPNPPTDLSGGKRDTGIKLKHASGGSFS